MLGPLMIDVAGTSLTAEDKEILAHPLVGGLILFSRNYQDKEQLLALTHDIRAYAQKDIIIAVDHEGGRVQRFRDQFSAIPPMGQLFNAANGDINHASRYAYHAGQLMAMEVMAINIDISFAPVLDVNGISDVIGDRSFHQDPSKVTILAKAFIEGMHSVGMRTTGKHFPGHGSIKEDSHIAMPVDKRSWQDIYEHDCLPFRDLIQNKLLDAMMPAHIVFPDVDHHAVGFSQKWLQQILRQQLGFEGVIFSDDLSMKGASIVGGFIERTEAAQQAGCDMLLVCNDRNAAIEAIDNANISIMKASQPRLQCMMKQHQYTWSTLTTNPIWQQAKKVVSEATSNFAK
jgi:beta-N-acetylhexosaminidase